MKPAEVFLALTTFQKQKKKAAVMSISYNKFRSINKPVRLLGLHTQVKWSL
jgi:hypothetical protein